jgi:hypothetical protein
MMRGSLDSEFAADRAATGFTLDDPTDTALVPADNAGRRRNFKSAHPTALVAPFVKESLNCPNGVVAPPVGAFDQQSAIFGREGHPSRFEMVKNAIVDDIVRWLEILSAADMDWGQRCQRERNDFHESVHAPPSKRNGTTGAYPW